MLFFIISGDKACIRGLLGALPTFNPLVLQCLQNGEICLYGCIEILPRNLLIKDGGLEAVIDFAQLVIGDPACDLVITWNFFNTESRTIFKEKINLDKNTWIHAMGWCLWKTLCWPVKGTPVDRILNDLYRDYAHK
jgi:hypothetical protein